jgi:hypothetical protein
MGIEIRHAKKVTKGITTADLARHWGMTPQAADKKASKAGQPKPIVVISTTDDAGRIVKETKVWTKEQWGL